MNKKEDTIEYIIELTEKLSDNINVDKKIILKALRLISLNKSLNLNIYKGYLLLYYYNKNKRIPENESYLNLIQNNTFKKCVS